MKKKLTNTAERKAFVESMKDKEPEINPLNYEYSLAAYLNFHNQYTESKEIEKWAVKYVTLQKNPKRTRAIKQAEDWELRKLGIFVRANDTTYLEERHVKRIEEIIVDLTKKYGDEIKSATPTKPVLSIVERTRNLADQYIADIDEYIDLYLEGSNDFSMSGFVNKNNISAAVSSLISEHFENNLLQELIEAKDGNDKDLAEGYSFLTKMQMRKYVAFVQSIVDDCKQRVVSIKSVRRPRVQKQKAPVRHVANMKYAKDFEPLGLVSVDPKKIIGSKELWLYDPEKKKMISYFATDSMGLGVKGTTIQDFDVKRSGIKSVKNPEITFETKKFNRSEMNKVWKLNTSKQGEVSGRTNERLIIIGVY